MLRAAFIVRLAIVGVLVAVLGLGALDTWQATPQALACHGVDPKTGDLNADGTTGSDDAQLVLVYQAGLTQPPPAKLWLAAADVNCDSRVNAIDANLILQVAAGLTTLRP